MARLSKHLQYFVNKKISEDAEWRGVEIILSGHDVRPLRPDPALPDACPLLTLALNCVFLPQVPGEGEHKIQEYIRLSKAQAD